MQRPRRIAMTRDRMPFRGDSVATKGWYPADSFRDDWGSGEGGSPIALPPTEQESRAGSFACPLPYAGVSHCEPGSRLETEIMVALVHDAKLCDRSMAGAR